MSETCTNVPPNAKKVGGVWLPASETHFEEWMTRSKRARRVDGRLTYQYHKLEAALALQPRGRRSVALDIGAHVGLWAMWLTRAFDHVHAFEPAPPHAAILPFNMTRPNWTLHRCALGERAGRIDLTVPCAQTGGAYVEAGRVGAAGAKYDAAGSRDTWHGLPLRTLDSFGFETVDFIKIDVEGVERAVLAGGRETIRRCRPNVVVEQKGNDAHYGEPRDAALALLRSWGMKPLKVLSGDWILGW